MGRLRLGPPVCLAVGMCLFLLLPACGKGKPPGSSPFPVKITLTPSTSASLQVGSILTLTATAQNDANSNISPPFVFTSSNPSILDIAPTGIACAGTWNAPSYSLCTPAGTGVAQVIATALGATSAPTLIFVHPPIDNIQISVVPPVNSPPPACPSQQALPEACNIKFNPLAQNYCLSQNQVETLQATAYSQGVDITGSVGPFTFSEVNPAVATTTSIINTSYNVATNQVTVSPSAPGQTQIIASASGVYSAPFNFETCPVQCIDLQVGVSGTQSPGQTSFVVNKGTTETITATAVDVQGCVVPKPPLTWVSTQPAALSPGGSMACAGSTTCSISTTQSAAASITASCTPPTCNIGFPLNPAGFPAPYIPQPVYPVTAISGLVTPGSGSTTGTGTTGSTGTTSSNTAISTTVLATSQDCYSSNLCTVGLYNVPTTTNLPGRAYQLPEPPNSLIYDAAGDKAFLGSAYGAFAITPGNLGTSTGPFTQLAAPATQLGLVTGKVLAVSNNGAEAIFSDTISTPNQVYVVSTSSATSTTTTPLNINAATAATVSPDGLKSFILANGGTTLYIYSPLQALQPPITLPAPATSIAFSSTGSFALLAGGGSPFTNLSIYNTCDNSAVTLTPPPPPPAGLPGPPIFLTMVPAGNVPTGSSYIPSLQPIGLDFFFGLDNTGIDIIATTSSLLPLPLPQPFSPTTLCPQIVTLAQTTAATTFAPVHINIGQGTFNPIDFFISPDATQAYIVASDRSSVLVYNFSANSVSSIPLVNNANPVAAGITVDGSLIYVAGSDGLLHELNTYLAVDQNQTTFTPLMNSTSSFCYTGFTSCALDLVAVKP